MLNETRVAVERKLNLPIYIAIIEGIILILVMLWANLNFKNYWWVSIITFVIGGIVVYNLFIRQKAPNISHETALHYINKLYGSNHSLNRSQIDTIGGCQMAIEVHDSEHNGTYLLNTFPDTFPPYSVVSKTQDRIQDIRKRYEKFKLEADGMKIIQKERIDEERELKRKKEQEALEEE
jgi:hypothetical protein